MLTDSCKGFSLWLAQLLSVLKGGNVSLWGGSTCFAARGYWSLMLEILLVGYPIILESYGRRQDWSRRE